MDLPRIVRHLACTHWHVRRAFPRATLDAIQAEIRHAEALHTGEIRFVVEGALHGAALLAGQTARQRAIELFARLHVWDTEANNGVLIYLLLSDRQFEIVADRGIAARVPPETWHRISQAMARDLADGAFREAAVNAVQAVAGQLAADPGAPGPRHNELPDRPLLL